MLKRMEKRLFGKTDMLVSRLGMGLSEIGYGGIDLATAAEVLNTALDNGINFLDTAACYLVSEEFVGKTVSHRRSDYYLATKAGHLADGYQGIEWSAKTIADSIDRSLRRMKTDYLDLVQLHSCSLEILQRGEAIEALQKARQEGKTRFIGYSGDNEAAEWAVDSGLFDSLQTSFNLVDQKARYRLFAKAKANKLGVIVKRPIANSAWRASSSPSAYAESYFKRAQQMQDPAIAGEPENRIYLALAFTFAHDAVDVAIVGTKTPKYMQANIAMLNEGLALSQNVIDELYRRFDELGGDWPQLG